MLNAGKHTARAVSATFGKSSKKGTDGVTVTFEVEVGNGIVEQIDWAGWFTETTAQRTIESLQHCGCTFPNGDITDLTGLGSQEVELVVENEQITDAHGVVKYDEFGQPRTRPRVQWVNRKGSAAVVEFDSAGKNQLRAKMKGLVLKVQQEAKANGTAPKPVAAAQTQARASVPSGSGSSGSSTGTDDDLPF